MTKNETLTLFNRFLDIIKTKPSHNRDMRLGNLMTDLEVAYQIPLVGKERIEAFKEEQPFVYGVYLAASRSRTW